jgi:hypothetical protein
VRELCADQAVQQQIVRREVEQLADAYELQIADLAFLRSAAGPSLLTLLRHAAADFMRCAAVSAHDANAHQACVSVQAPVCSGRPLGERTVAQSHAEMRNARSPGVTSGRKRNRCANGWL